MKARVFLYCLLGGVPLIIAALGAGHLLWWWLSGVLFAASFVPVALFGPRTALGQFAVIAPALLIVTVLCTWSEALIFMPQIMQHAVRDLFSSIAMYLILAGILAALAQALKLSKSANLPATHRSLLWSAAAVLLSGFAYVVYYLIFGAITYQYFTKGFFPGAEQVVGRLGLWFWAIQFARGVLMTLAVVPILLSLRMKRWQAAIVVGLLIWIAGGAGPLVVPNPVMGGTQRLIHTVEIFTQNFSLGFTAALLFLSRPLHTTPAQSHAPSLTS